MTPAVKGAKKTIKSIATKITAQKIRVEIGMPSPS
jgi:hypothetical protein